MDTEIELMKAIESQFFQVQCRQVPDKLLLVPFDLIEVKLSLNNLNIPIDDYVLFSYLTD